MDFEVLLSRMVHEYVNMCRVVIRQKNITNAEHAYSHLYEYSHIECREEYRNSFFSSCSK